MNKVFIIGRLTRDPEHRTTPNGVSVTTLGVAVDVYKRQDSVWASVGASVGAYISSFFSLDEWQLNGKIVRENPFQPAIDLWEAGLVHSFDGKVWRLHAGKDAQIVSEMEAVSK